MNNLIKHYKYIHLSKKTLIFTISFAVFGVILWGVFFLNKDNSTLVDKCLNINEKSLKVQCWKDQFEKNLEKGNVNGTMGLVASLYEKDTDFSSNCHDFVHLIGRSAYKLFSEGKEFEVGPETSYCAYGFYHGFMESLVSQKGDVASARSFCNYVDSQLSKKAPGAYLACFHGIGHGWANIHDESLKGNERAIVYPALNLCEKITQDPEELKICATGVFDSISIGYYNNINGIKINEKDPFWLCKEQKDQYKTPCYMDLAPAILWLGEGDIEKSLSYIKYAEKDYLATEVQSITEGAVRYIVSNNKDIKVSIDTCRKLSLNLSDVCIKGLGLGYLQFAHPGKESESGVNFCKNDYLSGREKEICFDGLLTNMSGSITDDKYKEICETVGEYKKYCVN